MKQLLLVLAESALELAPRETRRHPALVADARRRGREPGTILLDRSLHHAAMTKLTEDFKRGRPDLVHATLLAITGSPLFLDGGVRLYVHTADNVVLEFAEKTRIPKNYLRFRGLAEKILSTREDAEQVKVYSSSLKDLISKRVQAERVWGLSTQGKEMRMEDLAERLAEFESPCALIGGFPHGHFSPETVGRCDELVRVGSRPLEAHVVASRLVYEVEKVATHTEK